MQSERQSVVGGEHDVAIVEPETVVLARFSWNYWLVFCAFALEAFRRWRAVGHADERDELQRSSQRSTWAPKGL